MLDPRFVRRLPLALLFTFCGSALAFCGFYVARGDARLLNRSSEVVIARSGNRTVLTMANDYRGPVADFALVVPIPYAFERDQIAIGDAEAIRRLDAFSAPRLVEYHDSDPCGRYDADVLYELAPSAAGAAADEAAQRRAQALGVTVVDRFSVGEYDILILDAEQSAGLETWLVENGYRIPDGASAALAPYIAAGMHFFVARVDLEAHADAGFQPLRPLTMAFESDALMLPLQLGRVNADGPQELVVYLLSDRGRIVLANYPTVPLPTDVDVPTFVEQAFPEVYRDLVATTHDRALREAGRGAALLEHAWDAGWCDPCVTAPLDTTTLLRAGAFWLDPAGPPSAFLTRLRIRYDATTFPEDLRFRVVDDREPFQARYVMHHPFEGPIRCEAGRDYVEQVGVRRDREARNLASLTGWPLAEVRERMRPYQPQIALPKWWDRVFDTLLGG